MHDHPEIQLVPAENIHDALNLVSSGKADAYIGDAASTHYAIKREGMLNLGFSGDTTYKSYHRMAATRLNPELASLLAKALADIPQAEKDAIQNRWMSLKYEPGVKTETVLLYARRHCRCLLLLSPGICVCDATSANGNRFKKNSVWPPAFLQARRKAS